MDKKRPASFLNLYKIDTITYVIQVLNLYYFRIVGITKKPINLV